MVPYHHTRLPTVLKKWVLTTTFQSTNLELENGRSNSSAKAGSLKWQQKEPQSLDEVTAKPTYFEGDALSSWWNVVKRETSCSSCQTKHVQKHALWLIRQLCSETWLHFTRLCRNVVSQFLYFQNIEVLWHSLLSVLVCLCFAWTLAGAVSFFEVPYLVIWQTTAEPIWKTCIWPLFISRWTANDSFLSGQPMNGELTETSLCRWFLEVSSEVACISLVLGRNLN